MRRKNRPDIQPGDWVKVRYPGEYTTFKARVKALRDGGQTVDLVDHPFGAGVWSAPVWMVTAVVSPDAPMLGGIKPDDRTGQEPLISRIEKIQPDKDEERDG
jgi:hypothetical protein